MTKRKIKKLKKPLQFTKIYVVIIFTKQIASVNKQKHIKTRLQIKIGNTYKKIHSINK